MKIDNSDNLHIAHLSFMVYGANWNALKHQVQTCTVLQIVHNCITTLIFYSFIHFDKLLETFYQKGR